MGVNLLMIAWLRIRVDCLIVYLALDWALFGLEVPIRIYFIYILYSKSTAI